LSKAPDDVDALLLRIATLKWQAVTVLSSSRDGLAREDAAAFVATLDAIESMLHRHPAPDALQAAKERIESLATLRDHAPERRTAGQA
jgi:hypothetical protein